MSVPELLGWSLAELARRLRTGEVSSREATAIVLDALDGRGRELGAVARLEPERALAAADEADARRLRGEPLGPLHGVPLAHKDMFYRAGELAELGAAMMRDHRPAETATVLARLDAAGAVDAGRLNMVEFALGITGHNDHTGHPRNPWDPRCITGGSTSGGAAAVAARLISGTLGSDTGGSIRYPAACCGLIGLKPTYGLVSRFGCMPLSHSLDHVGPLARSAEDTALLLQAVAGHDPQDPTTSTRPVPDYLAGLGRGVEGLRLAVAEAGLDTLLEAEVAIAVGEAVGRLEQTGMRVARIEVPAFAPVNALRRLIMLVECAALHRDRVEAARERYNPQTLARMEPGFPVSGVDYVRALAARAPLLRRFCAEVFAGADVLALPTCPVPTPGIRETDTGGDARFTAVANRLGTLVGPFNLLGLPAINVPAGLDRRGLPVGLQLVAKPFGEALLLRVAHALETAGGTFVPSTAAARS
jgi:aspartyl-tRNA(Asn)/glutamyl-tRNA(Gln) amidotransferase subunit A